jgi:hypothetical protein
MSLASWTFFPPDQKLNIGSALSTVWKEALTLGRIGGILGVAQTTLASARTAQHDGSVKL